MGGFCDDAVRIRAMLPGRLLTSELGLSGQAHDHPVRSPSSSSPKLPAAGVISQKDRAPAYLIANAIVMATVDTLLYYLLKPTRSANRPSL